MLKKKKGIIDALDFLARNGYWYRFRWSHIFSILSRTKHINSRIVSLVERRIWCHETFKNIWGTDTETFAPITLYWTLHLISFLLLETRSHCWQHMSGELILQEEQNWFLSWIGSQYHHVHPFIIKNYKTL